MTNKRKVETCKQMANQPKQLLMYILDELESAGATKDAELIEKIIIKLEVWQNK